jgi:hypothetical protein
MSSLFVKAIVVGAAVSAGFCELSSSAIPPEALVRGRRHTIFYAALVSGLAWFCIQRWGLSGLAVFIAVVKVAFTVGPKEAR